MLSEAEWEERTLEELSRHGWINLPGSKVAPGAEGGRTSWDELVLPGRALAKLRELNPTVPATYLEQALAEILAPT
ncbi:MAG: hypothetical protein ACRCYU_01790, partial [Nocardioides sp.]